MQEWPLKHSPVYRTSPNKTAGESHCLPAMVTISPLVSELLGQSLDSGKTQKETRGCLPVVSIFIINLFHIQEFSLEGRISKYLIKNMHMQEIVIPYVNIEHSLVLSQLKCTRNLVL
jgi:hypothetical protein